MNSLALLSLYWVTSAAGGTPRVEFQREVVGYVGQNVTLRCSLVDGGQNTQVVQVSWVRSPEQKLVVFNPSFGTSYPSGDWAGRLSVSNDSARLKETSLTVTACHSQDQGQYSCDFTIFPSGMHRGQITLTIAELVEIPVLEPVLLSCLQSPWSPSPNSSSTVQWFRWSQAGGGWSLVLTVQFEGRTARCSGELSACSTDLYWTPSLSQAGRYRCHWTNGTGHFNRTLLLRASSTGPLLSGLRSHTITALVLTGLGVSVTLLILVLQYWRMARRKGKLSGAVELTQPPDSDLHSRPQSPVSCGKMQKCFLVIEGLVVLSVLQVCAINADSPCVEGAASTLTASVGGDVVLPCQLIPSASAVGMKVLWTRKGFSSPVHFYTEESDETHSQHEDYRGRTHLFKEELNKGNVSLKLSKIRVSDEASYECLVTSTLSHSDASVELKVMGTHKLVIYVTFAPSNPILPEYTSIGMLDDLQVFRYESNSVRPEVSIKARSGKQLTLRCVVTGFYPQDISVDWLQDGEIISTNVTTTGLLPNHDMTYQVQNAIEIEDKLNHRYSCRVQHSSLPEILFLPWGRGNMVLHCKTLLVTVKAHLPCWWYLLY
ncbi:Myelin-oligodendrocyte glycoprotein [Acipenser ruthenus]|uniref:Myelin-oligodendrocyte glycoprotein n=1 Tax=Acipenser ruthenus TaxID=7906 RepID=A0A662YRM9_ACIRT|nr:Myelin-oligodendrocyte glycoprotein [Acipenser ruthenus]